jgi:hypothetical protein
MTAYCPRRWSFWSRPSSCRSNLHADDRRHRRDPHRRAQRRLPCVARSGHPDIRVVGLPGYGARFRVLPLSPSSSRDLGIGDDYWLVPLPDPWPERLGGFLDRARRPSAVASRAPKLRAHPGVSCVAVQPRCRRPMRTTMMAPTTSSASVMIRPTPGVQDHKVLGSNSAASAVPQQIGERPKHQDQRDDAQPRHR